MFTFKSREAYAVDTGELRDHLRDAALSAMTLEILTKFNGHNGTLSFALERAGKGRTDDTKHHGRRYMRVSDVVGGMDISDPTPSKATLLEICTRALRRRRHVNLQGEASRLTRTLSAQSSRRARSNQAKAA